MILMLAPPHLRSKMLFDIIRKEDHRSKLIITLYSGELRLDLGSFRDKLYGEVIVIREDSERPFKPLLLVASALSKESLAIVDGLIETIMALLSTNRDPLRIQRSVIASLSLLRTTEIITESRVIIGTSVEPDDWMAKLFDEVVSP